MQQNIDDRINKNHFIQEQLMPIKQASSISLIPNIGVFYEPIKDEGQQRNIRSPKRKITMKNPINDSTGFDQEVMGFNLDEVDQQIHDQEPKAQDQKEVEIIKENQFLFQAYKQYQINKPSSQQDQKITIIKTHSESVIRKTKIIETQSKKKCSGCF